MRTHTGRRSLPVVVALAMIATMGLGAPGARAVTDRAPAGHGESTTPHAKTALYDVRTTPASRKTLRALTLRASNATSTLRSKLGSQSMLQLDPLTGTVRVVGRADGFLTNASKASPQAVALGYLTANAAALGMNPAAIAALRLTRDYVDIDGTHHLAFQQKIAGVPVFGNGLKAAVTKDGRLVNLTGSPLATLTTATSSARLTKAQAVAAAGRAVKSTKGSVMKQVYFRTVEGTRLAYQTLVHTDKDMFLTVVDGVTGTLFYRRSLVNNANADVLENRPGAPAGGGTRHTVSLDQWLNPGANRLIGPNVHAYSDINDNDAASANEETNKSGGNFQFPFTRFFGDACPAGYPCSWDPDTANSWQTNRNQSATQLFYFVNKFHDHLEAAPIGFNNAAGNFEGDDAIEGQNLDGANIDGGFPDDNHIDNANFATPPDGTPGRMQMYLFHSPGASFPDEDPFVAVNGSDTADIVFHENGHGLSNRLVVDADGNSTLASFHANAMGEAWSDWYAVDFLVKEGFITDTATPGEVKIGDYVDANQNLIRFQGLDCPANGGSPARCPGGFTTGPGGFTFGDFGKVFAVPEVHSEGEIWGETLWDLRTGIGSTASERLITRAMELSPPDPSFLDMRNALLQADKVAGAKNFATIWKVFAGRGMGYFAGAIDASDLEPVEDFHMPPSAQTPRGSVTGTVTDQDTGQPLEGIAVGFAGHDSGFGNNLADETDAAGKYTINGAFYGTYPKLFARGAGFEAAQFDSVTINTPSTTRDFLVRRDWASIFGGAEVSSFTGPDYSSFGCGPDGAIDQNLSAGWGSDTGVTDEADGQATPKKITVKLPEAIDIGEIGVDPNATCGDSGSSSTRRYRIETSTTGLPGSFHEVAAGTFYLANRGHLNSVALVPSATSNVRYVRFTMIAPQVPTTGDVCDGPANCPDGGVPERCGPDAPNPAGFSGCIFMDMSELTVYGAPH